MSSKKKSTKSTKKSSKSSSSSNNKNEATFSESMSSFWEATKKKASEVATAAEQRMTMEGLLTQARISLEHYLDPKVIPAEERMSRDILRGAKGIALITEAKGGFIVGVKGGSGVILVKKQGLKKKKLFKNKKPAAQWSSPCAVGTGGISVGLLAGATKVDHIIVLSTQDQVDMFLSKGQLQLKGNTNATVAKWGRNADAGIGVGTNTQTGTDKQAVAPIFTYSFGVKGIYGGISLDGEVLAVRKDCNEVFYQKTVHVKDILTGAVKMPNKNKDYQNLCKLLNDYCTGSDDDDEKKNDDGFDLSEVQPPQRRPTPGQGKGNKNNQNANKALVGAMAQNKDVQNAGKSAMKDKNVRNAAFNAYKSGGNDQNANKQLVGALAKNKAVQGAAVSAAKDDKVQKAAWKSAKQNAKQYMNNNNNNNDQTSNYV